MDYEVREDGFSETCENGKPKCCYDSKSEYETLTDTARGVCKPEPFCCHLKSGKECPVFDYDLRGAEPPGKCCYESKSVYEGIPNIENVCTAEPKFCCRLKAGEVCPVQDFGVRQDDITDNEATFDYDGECCYDSRAEYDAIPDIQGLNPIKFQQPIQ